MREYSPDQVNFIVSGHIVTDWETIRAARDEDAFFFSVGTDGQTTRVKNLNQAGKISVALRQGSPSNQFLSSLTLADQVSNGGVFPVLIADLSGTDLHVSPISYIMKYADVEFGKQLTGREFVIQCSTLTMNIGANAIVTPATSAA